MIDTYLAREHDPCDIGFINNPNSNFILPLLNADGIDVFE